MITSGERRDVALVTGAASGIGAATCRRLAADGAQVFVADLDLEGAEVVAREVGGSALRVDVADEDSVRAMVQAVIDAAGRLDVAVNNAGIGDPARMRIGSIDSAAWRKVMQVNIDGVFHCLNAQLPVMQGAGRGSIVNVASVAGAVGMDGLAAYVASKHAVVGLTKVAAIEQGPQGVRINAVGPGYVDTPLLAHHDAAVRQRTIEAHPIGRLGSSEEIASVIAFLASSEASFVTGAYYPVDGGYLAR